MVYPTVRATLLMASGLPVTLILALFFPGLWTIGAAWIAGIAGMIFLDGFLAAPRRAQSLSPSVPAMNYIGETEEVIFTYENASGRIMQRPEFRLSTNMRLKAVPDICDGEASAQGCIAKFDVTSKRRGEGMLERLWVRWQGPLGLIWKQNVEPLDIRLPIISNIRLVKETAIEIFSRDASFGHKIQQDRGEGTEFDALMEFQTGMDRRAIDWKHSARHKKLLAKEYRTERNHNVVFAFDSGHLMCEPVQGITKLDRALNASLIMAYVCLKIGDKIGYYAFDEKPYFYSQPVGGVRSFGHLQNLTASIDYSLAETNFTLGLSQLSQNLKRRSLIVVFTDFVDSTNAELMIENISRLIRRHVVIFVAYRDETLETMTHKAPETTEDISRAVIAESLLRERDLVIARLQRMGVHIVDTDAAQLNIAVLNKFLELKRREMI